MDVKIAEDWKDILQPEFDKPYFVELVSFVKDEYKSKTVYPPGSLIFNAFDQCRWDDLKVVIIGQDPYHGPNQANGMCFSVNQGVPFPPSLRNIFKEISSEYDRPLPDNGDLTHWANQGVLLLNATLTVRAHQAGSHQGKGWERFTDQVIKIISQKKQNIVYLLWGSFARKKKELIDPDNNLILESPHPSPLSAHRGFFGNDHFKKAAKYIEDQYQVRLGF
ncbi:MAG: uracil-DNA glycosylase [Bacteroidetes bacterium]|nr:MAG: uracil-DNA glycosylase [Bacteroidota bacterium]